jgi:hypothetical protein
MKINQCCLKSINQAKEKRQEIAIARKEFVLAMALIIIVAITGEMIYLDCIERGIF